MTASATPLPAVRAALGALVDYAGVFPPAQLPLEHALGEYLQARRGPDSWMLGRFIVRLSQVDQLAPAVPSGERLPLCLILDQGPQSVRWAAELRTRSRALSIDALEIALAPDQIENYARSLDEETGLRAIPSYVEAPVTAFATLARCGLGAKLRCGGMTPEAYPSPEQAAAFIWNASRNGVPFKATAGLHHPVRHYNEAAGATMHGFLNLLAASALALQGAPLETITRAVQTEDAAAFTMDSGGLHFEERLFDASLLREVRARSFIAYGSCSFSEPVDDLRAMGILP